MPAGTSLHGGSEVSQRGPRKVRGLGSAFEVQAVRVDVNLLGT